MNIMGRDLTEDELRAAIRAMIDEQATIEAVIDEALRAAAHNANMPSMAWRANEAIDATHAARKRRPIEWPEVK